MPVASLAATLESPWNLDVDALIVGIAPGEVGAVIVGADAGPLAAITEQLSALGLTGATDETARIPSPEGVAARSILLVGVGRAPLNPEGLRSVAGTAARAAGGASRVAIALPTTSATEVQAVLEGAALGAYRFGPAREGDAVSDPPAGIATIELCTQVDDAAAAAEVAAITAEAVCLVRDLVTTPPNQLYPETFVERAVRAAEGLPLDVEVWGTDELEAGGFGGILGVGQGSARPPRLMALRYRPSETAPHLALVGKGITFDSGGLSLKPAAAMVGMKYDMTGAATVLAATIAAARLGVDARVTGWLCLAENMPSGSALRPNDVISTRSGTTVEVLNTDAEGRLVLADGLAAASEEQPDAIIDVATLTGAARVALGERYAGLMGDDELVAEVRAAAGESGELVWPMPLPAELRALLKTDVADIANAKPGNTAAGMLLAAVFLREFVGRRGDGDDAPRIPWAHLDIAGPANNATAPFGYTPKGSSGVITRTLIRVAERFATK
ncbi:MAG: leucyl aminopeptidase [Microcella sp.]|uniref:leucyl aminopeptidase n=1 Tax=Microcella sp. TaxID=1913979 RepID=UPI0024C90459|nr:leucyl aminopeptidase [Microcella sp.]UYN84143.1 MAG: leucyl aminopeptidase [Microcella sp.]